MGKGSKPRNHGGRRGSRKHTTQKKQARLVVRYSGHLGPRAHWDALPFDMRRSLLRV